MPTPPPDTAPLATRTLVLLIALGLTLFALAAVVIVRDLRPNRVDHDLAWYLRSVRNDALVTPLATATYLGSQPVVWAGTLTLAGYLAWRRRWLLLAAWLVALLGAALIPGAVKNLFQIPRPFETSAFALPIGTYTFPSGHTFAAVTWLGMGAYLLGRLHPCTRTRASLLALLGILATGIGLVGIGVHYVLDVLGALGLAGAWTAACVLGTQLLERRRNSASTPTPARPSVPGSGTDQASA